MDYYKLRNEVDNELFRLDDKITDEQAILYDMIDDMERDEIYNSLLIALAKSLFIKG